MTYFYPFQRVFILQYIEIKRGNAQGNIQTFRRGRRIVFPSYGYALHGAYWKSSVASEEGEKSEETVKILDHLLGYYHY